MQFVRLPAKDSLFCVNSNKQLLLISLILVVGFRLALRMYSFFGIENMWITQKISKKKKQAHAKTPKAVVSFARKQTAQVCWRSMSAMTSLKRPALPAESGSTIHDQLIQPRPDVNCKAFVSFLQEAHDHAFWCKHCWNEVQVTHPSRDVYYNDETRCPLFCDTCSCSKAARGRLCLITIPKVMFSCNVIILQPANRKSLFIKGS